MHGVELTSTPLSTVRRILQIAICLAGLWLLGSWFWKQPQIRDFVHRTKVKLNPSSDRVVSPKQPRGGVAPELPPQATSTVGGTNRSVGESKVGATLDGVVNKLRSSVTVLSQEITPPRSTSEHSTAVAGPPVSPAVGQFKESGDPAATGPEDFGRLWRKLQQNHQMLTQP